MTSRQTLPANTAESRLVVVLRGQRAEDLPPVIATMAEAGVRSFELTLTTPDVFALLPTLIAEHGPTVDFGIGTITTPEQVDEAVAAGAKYLVTPVTDPAVIDRALDRSIPLIPGGFTPSELFSSWSRGVAAVKVFPAGRLGAGYVKDLRGPFPDMIVVPSGGVDLDSAREWLAAGAAAVSVGGPLLGDALKGGDLGELAERTRAFVEVCTGSRSRC